MSTASLSALIGIVIAFGLFMGTLAWSDRATRHPNGAAAKKN